MGSHDLRSAAARGTFWAIVNRGGSKLVGLAIFLALSRLLEPRAFGLVGMAKVFVYLIQLFVEHGLGEALVQRERLDREHLDTAFWANLALGVGLACGGIALTGTIASLFREPDLAPIVRWFSLAFVLAALGSAQQALLERRLAFRALAVRGLLAEVAGGAVGLFMALEGLGAWSLVGQTLARGAAGAALVWQASGWKPGFGFSFDRLRELLPYGLTVIGDRTLLFLSRRVDDLLIGAFLGATALGFYTVAYQFISEGFNLVVGSVGEVAFPVFARVQEDIERLRRGFMQATLYTGTLAIPAFAGVALVAPEAVEALMGPQWTRSIPIVQVLALSGVAQVASHFAGIVFLAAGRPGMRLAISFGMTTACVVGFLIAVRWGMVAVAAAYCAGALLMVPVSVWMLRGVIALDGWAFIRQFLPSIASAVGMTVVVLTVRDRLELPAAAWIRLLILAASGAAVYLVLLRVLAPGLTSSVLTLVSRLVRSGERSTPAPRIG